jgi:hypothetical protein
VNEVPGDKGCKVVISAYQIIKRPQRPEIYK